MGLLEVLKGSYNNIGIEVEGSTLDTGDVSLSLKARIHPAAKQEKMIVRDDILNIFVKDRPIDGQANNRLRKILSKSLGIAPSSVLIDKGHRSKLKKIVLNYQLTPNKTTEYFQKKIETLCLK